MALKHSPDTRPPGHYRLNQGGLEAPASRRRAGVSVEAFGVSRCGAAPGADLGGSSKHSIKALQLLTDAEKGSTTTAIGRGLVGPKPRDNLPSNRLLSRSCTPNRIPIRALKEKKTFGRKGIRLIFRNPARYRYVIPPLTTTKQLKDKVRG